MFSKRLTQERAYYEARVQPLATLRAELAAEMRGLLPEAEVSVSFLRREYVYLTQFQAGADLPCLARRSREADDIEVLVDLDAVAAQERSTYAEFGLTEPGPKADILAWSVDLTGAEKYSLRFRDLTTGEDLKDRVEGTYYTGAWDAAGTRFLYVVPDHAMRPWQVREHILGTPADNDRLVLQEDDESFEVTVRATRSGQWIVIESRSRDTSECWLLPTADTTALAAFSRRAPPGNRVHSRPRPNSPSRRTADGHQRPGPGVPGPRCGDPDAGTVAGGGGP